MDVTTLVGIIIGIVLVIDGIGFHQVINFFDIPSILIVAGGTMAAIVASYPSDMLFDIPAHIRVIFRGNKFNMGQLVDQLAELAEVPRRDGLLALEDRVDDIKNPFLKKGILIILDMNDSDKVRSLLEREISQMEIRHSNVVGLYESGSIYAPAFGMVGTLIGLIDMLKGLDLNAMTAASMGIAMKAESMGSSMSVALITTFYGCILANLFFHPIAKKLRIRQDEEELYCTTVVEGIVAIHTGKSPLAMKNELMSFIKETQGKKLKRK